MRTITPCWRRTAGASNTPSAGEGADQAAAGGGGLLDGGDRVGRLRVGGDLDPLAEGVDREPVVVSWALGRARAGPGGLAGAVAELGRAGRQRALGQPTLLGVQVGHHPMDVGATGRVGV